MKKVVATISFLSCILLSLTSCQTTKSRYRTPAEEALSSLQAGMQQDAEVYQKGLNPQIPNNIKNALIPDRLNQGAIANLYGKKFNIKVTNISAQLFFKNLEKQTGINMIVDPKIDNTVTLDLRNVTIADVLDTLKENYGFDYHQTNYGFHVSPAGIVSQTFHVNYLDIIRNSKSYTQINTDDFTPVNTGNVSNSVSPAPTPNSPSGSSDRSSSMVNTTTTIDFWNDLSASLKALIGNDNGRSIVINPESGTVVVKAYPSEIRAVSNFLDNLQSSMSRQVILEVKLLEVQLNDSYQGGIDWNILGFAALNGTALNPTASAVNSGLPYSTLNIHGANGNFSSIIQALQSQGNVQTIADPRVLTVNNQQAVIKIGVDKYFVTGITSNVSNNGTSNTVTTASVSLAPFFSGVILDITPQISENNQILLHLHPVITTVTQNNQEINIGGGSIMDLPLAQNTIREYDSIVRAGNQQVIVIGGLTSNRLDETVNGTPGISNIPFFGALFRSTSQNSSKLELVILLRPVIIGRNHAPMSEQIPVAEEHISEMNRGFHVGSLPQVFGNQAELEDR